MHWPRRVWGRTGLTWSTLAGVSLVVALIGNGPALAQPADPTLRFGPPTVFANSRGLQSVSVLVTNDSDDVTGFLVTGRWLINGEVVAKMSGGVSYVNPHQTRPVYLVTPVRNAVPDNVDDVEFDTESHGFEERSRTQSAVADLIRIGDPVISIDRFGFSTLALPVTNADSVAHSVTISVAFVKEGQIIGSGLGEVRDLDPAATVTTTVRMLGTTADADQTIILPDTILK